MKKIVFLLIFFFSTAPLFAATVSGTIDLKTPPPAPQKIDMGADPSCAAAHTEPVYTEEVVAGANGELKNVFVYIKTGLEGKTFDPPKEPAILDQKGCHYTPHVFGVRVNQDVQILNSDPTLHNVHGVAKNSKEFNLGMPIQGMKIKRKFDKPEVMVKFKCDVHPWMSAYAGVMEHPFFAVTDEQGKFTIDGLPPGKYTIEAWHEKYGVQQQEITASEDLTASANFSYSG